METKKIICVLVACLFSTLFVQAANLTSEGEKFRSNIMQFLKEEGFYPTIDEENNTVDFKKEGKLHWISISGSNPFYVELHRLGLKCDNADRDIAIAAVNEGNRKVRCAKAMLLESSISFAIEMYFHSAEEFRYIFYKNMNELEAMENAVSDYYNEHSDGASGAPFAIKSVSIANTDYNGNIITAYGNKIYSRNTKYLTPKVYIDAKQAGKYDICKVLYPERTLHIKHGGFTWRI